MKQYINEAFRLQQMAGIIPINSLNEKLDAVGHEDDDIDNDGDIDKSDKYLAKRRKAISKNMNEGKDYDAIAQAEFGMDYDQLGPNEQEWVRDEADNIMNEDNSVYGEPSQDHEASMAKAELRELISNATKLDQHIEEHTELPGWISAYITLASDYISSCTQSVCYQEKEHGEEDEEEIQVSIMEKNEE
jgi:hypothetical protein